MPIDSVIVAFLPDGCKKESVTTGTVPLVTFSQENVTMGTVPVVTLAVYRKLLIHVMSESW